MWGMQAITHNPRTGVQSKFDAVRIPAFKPGKAMKEAVIKKK